LRRRGVEFAVAGAAVSLTDSIAPAALVDQTIRSACEFAISGRIAEPFHSLIQGVTPMSLRTWQAVAILVLVVGGLVGGFGLLRPKAAPPGPAQPKPQANLRDQFNDPLPDGAVARLGTIAFRDSSWTRGVMFSPDANRVLTVGQRQIRVWE